MNQAKNSAGVAELAAYVVKASKDSLGIDLDYSVNSLRKVESLLTRMKKWQKGLDHQELAAIFGSYVGEVLVRNGDGKWVHIEKYSEWGVELPERVTAFPITQCYKFIVNGKNDESRSGGSWGWQ